MLTTRIGRERKQVLTTMQIVQEAKTMAVLDKDVCCIWCDCVNYVARLQFFSETEEARLVEKEVVNPSRSQMKS
jgi:hypothetical protein